MLLQAYFTGDCSTSGEAYGSDVEPKQAYRHWIKEVTGLPNILASEPSREDSLIQVKALTLRVLANGLGYGESAVRVRSCSGSGNRPSLRTIVFKGTIDSKRAIDRTLILSWNLCVDDCALLIKLNNAIDHFGNTKIVCLDLDRILCLS